MARESEQAPGGIGIGVLKDELKHHMIRTSKILQTLKDVK